MLNLEGSITLDRDTVQAKNLCDKFTSEDLVKIGSLVVDGYKKDCLTRSQWLKRNEAGMNLAMQIQETKSFPWQGCSNIKFPLVTIAALQFHSTAYPALIDGKNVVKCRVFGKDPTGDQKARADRVSDYMSWQCLEQDECWEPDQDRLLLTLPIMGTVYKKSYFDAGLGHNVSTLVMATDLVMDYYAKSVEACPRKTHVIPIFRNEMVERMRRGIYVDYQEEEWLKADAKVMTTHKSYEKDKRTGLHPSESDEATPFTALEQHCFMDLDCDGYAEPVIVTVEESTEKVLRIVTRFDRVEDIEYVDEKRTVIARISPTEYFTDYIFIPSPDGSAMGIGFGVLLGPLNESVDSAINQLFDAGTMANTAGGFLGRGAKIRGGIYEFSPFAWNRVDSTGDDLRKNIYPLDVREPSGVLFNLLTFLVEYTNRISGSTDMMVGENPGQNTPAETSRTVVQQGQKIFSAIFKRVYRSMKKEFKKLYVLNGINLPARVPFGDGGGHVAREDFTGDASGIVPAADPTIVSDAARFSQAVALAERSAQVPGYDPDAVEEMFLTGIGVKDHEKVYKGRASAGPPAEDPKITIAKIQAQTSLTQMQYANVQFMMTLKEDVRLNTAKIMELQAKAEAAIKSGDAKVDANKVNALNALANVLKHQNDATNRQIDMLINAGQSSGQSAGTIGTGTGIPGVEAAPGNAIASEMGGQEVAVV